MNKFLSIFLGLWGSIAYAHGGHMPLSGFFHNLFHLEYMLLASIVLIILAYFVYKKIKAKS